jgi:YD repeat-containing protein
MKALRWRFLLTFLVLVSASGAAQERVAIAVLPFSSAGVSADDTFGLTLLFETALQTSGLFDVVEQTEVGRLMEAQEFAMSDLADDSKALRVGKLLVARQIVLGAAGKIGGQYYLNVKLLDVQSGRNLKAEKVLADTLPKLIDAIQALAERLSGAEGATTRVEEAAAPSLPIRRTIYTPVGKVHSYFVFSYDGEGRIARSVRFGGADDLQGYFIHEYDTAGNELKRTERDRDGKVVRFYTFTYDEAGRLLAGEFHIPTGQVERKMRYEYDAKGRLTRTSYLNISGSLFSYYTHQYDPSGQEIMRSYYDPSGKIISYETVEYLRSRSQTGS